MQNPWNVEGLRYPSAELADVVAARFARRYGRDITVSLHTGGDDPVPQYVVTQNGHKTPAPKVK